MLKTKVLQWPLKHKGRDGSPSKYISYTIRCNRIHCDNNSLRHLSSPINNTKCDIIHLLRNSGVLYIEHENVININMHCIHVNYLNKNAVKIVKQMSISHYTDLLLLKKPEQVKKFLPIGRYRLKILQAKIGSKQVIFKNKQLKQVIKVLRRKSY